MPSHDTFLYFNQYDVTSEPPAIHLQHGLNLEKNYFSSAKVGAGVGKGCVAATAILAQRLNLAEGDQVYVTCSSAKSLKQVAVRPKTQDDYNILENVHSLMEFVMMDQVRVVAPCQKLPLKVGNIIVDLQVESFSPSAPCGRLEKYTEVEILEPAGQSENLTVMESHQSQSYSINDVVWKFFKWGMELWNPHSKHQPNGQKKIPRKQAVMDAFQNPYKQKIQYRVQLEHVGNNSDVIYTNCGLKKEPIMCKISTVPERTSLFVKTEKEVISEMEGFACSRGEMGREPQVYLTKFLMRKLNVTVGSRVTIHPVQPKSEEKPKPHEGIIDIPEPDSDIFLWNSFEKLLSDVKSVINCLINKQCDRNALRTKCANNALVTGAVGSGKSTLLKKLPGFCEKNNVYCTTVQCKLLRGKTVESLLKKLSGKFSECAYREPSVLLLDDLDQLLCLPGEGEEESAGQSASYCKRVAVLLGDLCYNFTGRGNICLVATASSALKLGPLTSPRGPRLFHLVTKIPEMCAEERAAMLVNLGVKSSPAIVDKTSGYRVQDIVDLVSRARLKAIINETRLDEKEDFLLASLDDFTPMALQGVSLEAELPYTWADVGGCLEVKKSLEEQFRWPTEFSEVFTSCPLTLQTGALLYGAPGTGKTLLAAALAHECGINFISVKGPELLSKYVGASEAGVRNLFERAQQAKPCLLFFDELDSLAPKRGADSSGVTDRVVNQLLTELDGVEGRDGVWVLGASSRPDLIDAALLRPGRIDRAIHCPMPTQEEREEILHVLARSVQLQSDVSLKDLANQSNGFTGADLHALVYNAQIKAIKEQGRSVSDGELPLSVQNFIDAFDETRPSLSKADLLKYQQIFQRFQSRKGESSSAVQQQQKVTYA